MVRKEYRKGKKETMDEDVKQIFHAEFSTAVFHYYNAYKAVPLLAMQALRRR
jgi:hypothetical protein